MSTSLGSVMGLDLAGQGSGIRVHVTRFYGGASGWCLQLTIGDRYVQLDAEGRAALVEKLTTVFDDMGAEPVGRKAS